MGHYDDYKELLTKALENDTRENRIELADWLYRYGDTDFWGWNGETWDLPESGYRLKPILEFVDELEVDCELVDAELLP